MSASSNSLSGMVSVALIVGDTVSCSSIAESIVLDHTVCAQGDLFADLNQLQDILEDHVPAYVLARLDDPPTQWLAISYVPDTAKVRDKVRSNLSLFINLPITALQMLYASTRNSLTKSLGSASFSDALFANHKSDLTPTAYAAHRRHLAAPKPLSVQEREMEDVRAATIASSTEGSAARRNHLGGAGIHITWPETVSVAMRRLASEETDRLVILGIDTATETLVLSAESECAIGEVGSLLPSSTPGEYPISTRKKTCSNMGQHMRSCLGRTTTDKT